MKDAKEPLHHRPFLLLLVALAAILTDGLTPSATLAQTSDQASLDGESTGSGYSASGKTGSADLADAYQNDFVSKLQNIDFASLLTPGTLIEVDDTPILKKEAGLAYQAGNQPLGMELMFAYMVAEYEKATVDLQLVKYSSVLRRPVWQTRWGVSLAIRGADQFADLQPIREGKSSGGRGASRGPTTIQSSDLENDAIPTPRVNTRVDMNQAFAGSMGDRVSNAPTTSMLSDEADRELDKALGLVAEITGQEFQKRYQQGDFGPALASVSPPPPPVEPRGTGMRPPVAAPRPAFTQAVSDALADSPEPPPMWRPGIVFLGQGDSSEIIKIAQTENLDFLLHFDVFLKQSRTDWLQNVSRCRLIQVSNGKALGVSKSMDSAEVARLVQSGRGDERSYIQEQLENLFTIIDRQIKAIDLPKLSPEVAKKRVASLISGDAGPMSLRSLAEVRLYQAQGLIDESVVDTVFNIAGGDEALTMLHGPLEDRLTTARKWAVRALNRKDGTSSF